MRTFALSLSLVVAGCSGNLESQLRNHLGPDGGAGNGGSGGYTGGGAGSGGSGGGGPMTPPVKLSPVPVPPTAQPAPVDPNPTSPDGLGWSAAPAMGAVQFVANRDSVK